MHDDRNDGQKEQQVNQAAGYMERRPAKYPKNQKYHK
jgi:hypothetical protein